MHGKTPQFLHRLPVDGIVRTHKCAGLRFDGPFEWGQERLHQVLLGDVGVEAVAVVRERARTTFIQLRPTPLSWVGILYVYLKVVTSMATESDVCSCGASSHA